MFLTKNRLTRWCLHHPKPLSWLMSGVMITTILGASLLAALLPTTLASATTLYQTRQGTTSAVSYLNEDTTYVATFTAASSSSNFTVEQSVYGLFEAGPAELVNSYKSTGNHYVISHNILEFSTTGYSPALTQSTTLNLELHRDLVDGEDYDSISTVYVYMLDNWNASISGNARYQAWDSTAWGALGSTLVGAVTGITTTAASYQVTIPANLLASYFNSDSKPGGFYFELLQENTSGTTLTGLNTTLIGAGGTGNNQTWLGYANVATYTEVSGITPTTTAMYSNNTNSTWAGVLAGTATATTPYNSFLGQYGNGSGYVRHVAEFAFDLTDYTIGSTSTVMFNITVGRTNDDTPIYIYVPTTSQAAVALTNASHWNDYASGTLVGSVDRVGVSWSPGNSYSIPISTTVVDAAKTAGAPLVIYLSVGQADPNNGSTYKLIQQVTKTATLDFYDFTPIVTSTYVVTATATTTVTSTTTTTTATTTTATVTNTTTATTTVPVTTTLTSTTTTTSTEIVTVPVTVTSTLTPTVTQTNTITHTSTVTAPPVTSTTTNTIVHTTSTVLTVTHNGGTTTVGALTGTFTVPLINIENLKNHTGSHLTVGSAKADYTIDSTTAGIAQNDGIIGINDQAGTLFGIFREWFNFDATNLTQVQRDAGFDVHIWINGATMPFNTMDVALVMTNPISSSYPEIWVDANNNSTNANHYQYATQALTVTKAQGNRWYTFYVPPAMINLVSSTGGYNFTFMLGANEDFRADTVTYSQSAGVQNTMTVDTFGLHAPTITRGTAPTTPINVTHEISTMHGASTVLKWLIMLILVVGSAVFFALKDDIPGHKWLALGIPVVIVAAFIAIGWITPYILIVVALVGGVMFWRFIVGQGH